MNLNKIINTPRLTGLHLRVLGICFLLNMLDGMDVLVISFAAPFISDAWDVSPGALGIVFSAALVGMALGAVFVSPYSDKLGRKKIIVGSICTITAGMWLTALSGSVTELAFFRFVAGLGIGSMLASLTSMVSEYAPDKYRNQAILILHAGYPIGAIIAGFMAAHILPQWGWQPLFEVTALISLCALPLALFLLPESLDFLISRQPAKALEKVNRILLSLKHTVVSGLPHVEAEATTSAGLSALLTSNLRSATLLLWLAFMMAFASLYFLLSWVVKLAVDAGLPVEDAMLAGISLNLGAFFGSVLLGWLSSKMGLIRVISVFFILGAIASVVYGTVDMNVAGAIVAIFILMFFVQGGFTGLYAVAARLYPTSIRTTGVGWAIGAGRVGAVSGPALAGVLIGAGIPVGWMFIIFSIPLLVATATILKINHQPVKKD
ncbi:MAG: MFS transporter [Alteromonadaceae bacterium]|nr:MFS transporter [Alteromonadaceae bacterium]